MNAARFMAGVIVASDEKATDLRIAYREATTKRDSLPDLPPEEREAGYQEYLKLYGYAMRVGHRNIPDEDYF